ncbi:hypothetical protein [Spiroplasma endosymbiont of Polydrusus formosus]|uniref:hypothetical protein n=1 Tax=Spiroplasma endosymbiont of Polydrusus formosus TaxID=3139326 RepID=UPI0035B53F25
MTKNYYFVYSHLYLNNNLLAKVKSGLRSVGGVIVTLLSKIPEIATFVGIVASLLISQWCVWNIPSYDQSDGVGIDLIKVVHQIITFVWVQ